MARIRPIQGHRAISPINKHLCILADKSSRGAKTLGLFNVIANRSH
ncbi:MAG: hypothetical protein JXR00_04570 [Sulfitobacter geojensis]